MIVDDHMFEEEEDEEEGMDQISAILDHI